MSRPSSLDNENEVSRAGPTAPSEHELGLVGDSEVGFGPPHHDGPSLFAMSQDQTRQMEERHESSGIDSIAIGSRDSAWGPEDVYSLEPVTHFRGTAYYLVLNRPEPVLVSEREIQDRRGVKRVSIRTSSDDVSARDCENWGAPEVQSLREEKAELLSLLRDERRSLETTTLTCEQLGAEVTELRKTINHLSVNNQSPPLVPAGKHSTPRGGPRGDMSRVRFGEPDEPSFRDLTPVQQEAEELAEQLKSKTLTGRRLQARVRDLEQQIHTLSASASSGKEGRGQDQPRDDPSGWQWEPRDLADLDKEREARRGRRTSRTPHREARKRESSRDSSRSSCRSDRARPSWTPPSPDRSERLERRTRSRRGQPMMDDGETALRDYLWYCDEPAPRRPASDCPRYDAKYDLDDYLARFRAHAKLNRWTYRECGLRLATSLVGEAGSVLSTIRDNTDYDEIVTALKKRFEPEGSIGAYAAKLWARECKRTETVADYGRDVRRLIRKAYPNQDLPPEMMVDVFMRGLTSKEMKKWLHNNKPRSLEEAIEKATVYEAFDDVCASEKHSPEA
jgi:hypothetical protein